MGTLRVVLDANILLSGIAYPRFRQDLDRVVARVARGAAFRLYPGGIAQCSAKACAPSWSDPIEQDDLVDILVIQAEIMMLGLGQEPALRDLHDQPVLGTVLAALKTSGADALITGGKDLLALSGEYPIVASGAFWEKHGAI